MFVIFQSFKKRNIRLFNYDDDDDDNDNDNVNG